MTAVAGSWRRAQARGPAAHRPWPRPRRSGSAWPGARRSSSAQVTFHSKAEMGTRPWSRRFRPGGGRARPRGATRPSTGGPAPAAAPRATFGKSARHCAAMSRLIDLVAHVAVDHLPPRQRVVASYSCISVSPCTRRKQASRAGLARRRRIATWKWPIALTPRPGLRPAGQQLESTPSRRPRSPAAAARPRSRRSSWRRRAGGAGQTGCGPPPRTRARPGSGRLVGRPRARGPAGQDRVVERGQALGGVLSRGRRPGSRWYAALVGGREWWSRSRSSRVRLPSASACCAKSQMWRPSRTFTSISGVVGSRPPISMRRTSTKRKVAMRRARSATVRLMSGPGPIPRARPCRPEGRRRWKTARPGQQPHQLKTRSVDAALANEAPTGWRAASSSRPGSTLEPQPRPRSRAGRPPRAADRTGAGAVQQILHGDAHHAVAIRIAPRGPGPRPTVRARGPGLTPPGRGRGGARRARGQVGRVLVAQQPVAARGQGQGQRGLARPSGPRSSAPRRPPPPSRVEEDRVRAHAHEPLEQQRRPPCAIRARANRQSSRAARTWGAARPGRPGWSRQGGVTGGTGSPRTQGRSGARRGRGPGMRRADLQVAEAVGPPWRGRGPGAAARHGTGFRPAGGRGATPARRGAAGRRYRRRGGPRPAGNAPGGAAREESPPTPGRRGRGWEPPGRV